MSQPSTTSRFIVAMTGSLLVVGATWMVRHPSDATRLPSLRAPASVRVDGLKKTRLNPVTEISREGKATGSFELSLAGESAADGVHLTGTVTADQPLAGHEFSWILPRGYRVVAGPKSGLVPDLQTRQVHTLSITVDRGQEPEQPIVLHVFRLVNSEPLGQVAQFDFAAPTALGAPTHASEKTHERFSDETYVQ